MSIPGSFVLNPVWAAGHYLHWGVISISVTNLIVIAVMVLLFVLALVVPFPHSADDDRDGGPR